MEYTNPPLGTATLLANLQNEGLVIMDERKANAFLENVSYFRFAAYLRPFKASDRHGYKENATFEKQQLSHHGRVWNRVMPVMPQLPMKLKQAWITNKPEVANRLYSVLCCLLYWLNAIDSRNELCANFKDLLSLYPEVDTNAMGFPQGWENEPLWK